MRWLLDTHIALWALTDPDRLPGRAAALLTADDAEPWVSVVTVWEVAIKRSVPAWRPGAISLPAAQFVDELKVAEVGLLALRPEHAFAVEALPRLSGDPFDRMLVAQAMTEPMRFLTADAELVGYSDLVTVV